MTQSKPLPPAVQAIRQINNDMYDQPVLSVIAAALRAAAIEIFPDERPPHEALMEWIRKHPDDLPPWQIRAGKRNELLAIAAELEGKQ